MLMAWLQLHESSFLTNNEEIDKYLRVTLPGEYSEFCEVETDEPLWDTDFSHLMRYNLVFTDIAPAPFEKLINPLGNFLEDGEYILFTGMCKHGWYLSPVQLLCVTKNGATHTGSVHWEESIKKKALKATKADPAEEQTNLGNIL